MKITITEGNKSVTIDTVELTVSGSKSNLNFMQQNNSYPTILESRQNKNWTLQEKSQLLDLAQQGWSIERIATQLKRKKSAIRLALAYRTSKPEWFKKA